MKKFTEQFLFAIRGRRIELKNGLPERIKYISEDPLNPYLHYKLGLEYYKIRNFLASIAQFRTANSLKSNFIETIYWLGKSYFKLGIFDLAIEQFINVMENDLSSSKLKEKSFKNLLRCFSVNKFSENSIDSMEYIINETKNKEQILQNLWKLEYLGYDQYQRNKIVADKINSLKNNLSIIDVGGGVGVFSLFVPYCNYILADYATNGIDGLSLPFGDKAIDIAVSCDTLEHIRKDKRKLFISEMIRVTKKRIYLVAPFGKATRQMEKFFYEIANNPWTKEHLEYDFTTLEEISSFLNNLHLSYKIYPCSFLPLHFAMTYLNIAFLPKDPSLFEKVNEFFNTNYAEICKIEPSCGNLIEIFIA